MKRSGICHQIYFNKSIRVKRERGAQRERHVLPKGKYGELRSVQVWESPGQSSSHIGAFGNSEIASLKIITEICPSLSC